MPGIDETENFFRVRLRDPGAFTRLRTIPFKRTKPRIQAVVGRLRGENTTTVQSLLFPKEDGWNRDSVRSWLDAHPDVGKAAAVEETTWKALEDEGVFPEVRAPEEWEAQAKGVPAAGAVVHKTHGIETKQVYEDRYEADVTISTSAIDRDREVVRPEGMKIMRPKRTPLVASHHYGDLRKHIGEMLRAKPEGEEIPARVRYFGGLGNEEADWGWTLVKLGVAAYSIGFRPIKFEDADLDDEKVLEQVRAGKKPLRTFTEWELVELSHVIVPSQREAVQREVSEAVTKGVIDQDLADRISDALAKGKPAGEGKPPADDADVLVALGLELGLAAEHYAMDAKDGQRWAAAGARGLPLMEDDAWDAEAAVATWRRHAGAVAEDAMADRGVQRRYRRGFLFHDAAKPESFASYKFPFLKLDGGRAKASRRALVLARQALAGSKIRTDAPPIAAAAERILNAYLGRPEDEGRGILPAQTTALVRLFGDRGLDGPDSVVVIDEDGQAVFRGAPVELVDIIERSAGGPAEVKTVVVLQVPGLKFEAAGLEDWGEEFTENLKEAIEAAVRKAVPNYPADSIASLTHKELAQVIVDTAEEVALKVVAKTAGNVDAYVRQ